MCFETVDTDIYIEILKEELVPAFGCTEPIAIAFAAAKATQVLGKFPKKLLIKCSNNIVKNAKAVVVPKSGNLKGISAAALIGAIGGDSSKGMEVLANVSEEDIAKVNMLINQGICKEELLESAANLHLIVRAEDGPNFAEVEILHTHMGVVHIKTDKGTVFEETAKPTEAESFATDRNCLTIENILHFADSVEISKVSALLQKQLEYNSTISQAGLDKQFGAGVGSMLLATCGNDVRTRAKAFAAAGSDARMSGCELPVITNSGSGNQGLTVSMPVIEYGKELGISTEKLYRCLCVSNLVAVQQKSKIGRLSAFCGAVSAAAGAGAGIAYMHGGGLQQVSQTIVNTLANVSGIVCDGAKPSCAAKVASCIDAAIMGFNLAMQQKGFKPGEGLVKNNVEETICGVAQMARNGMQNTDKEILKIMMQA